MTTALYETEVGNINIEFFSDDAPNTVKNFTNLISDGFYDGLAFHRVIPGFMAQGGCPNTREGASGMPGTGGPGYNIKCEINKVKILCYPRIFGYVFNPLSIFYCYEDNQLKAIFYEVKNTFYQ